MVSTGVRPVRGRSRDSLAEKEQSKAQGRQEQSNRLLVHGLSSCVLSYAGLCMACDSVCIIGWVVRERARARAPNRTGTPSWTSRAARQAEGHRKFAFYFLST